MANLSSNPWVDALRSTKSSVSLHPSVLDAVLKINPHLFGAGKSSAQVYDDLLGEIQPQAPVAVFSNERYAAVFSDMLGAVEGELDDAFLDIDKRRRALADEEEQLRAALLERVVDFLNQVQPGTLSSTSRDVLQQRPALLRKLHVDVKDINRRARLTSKSFQLPAR